MSEQGSTAAGTQPFGHGNGTVRVAPATTRSPLHHAQAIFAAFDAKDLDALGGLVTEDVRLQIGNADVVKGKAQFVEALETFFASVTSFRHTVTNVWSDLDAVIADMIWDVPAIIAEASKLWRLAAGDLIYTGTPEGVGPVVKGDFVEGEVEGVGALSFKII